MKKELTRKLQLDLVPPEIEEAIAEVFQSSLERGYEKHNWKTGYPIEEIILSDARRHINAYRKGKDINPDTGIHHLKHALANLAMAVYHLMNDRHDLDDRE